VIKKAENSGKNKPIPVQHNESFCCGKLSSTQESAWTYTHGSGSRKQKHQNVDSSQKSKDYKEIVPFCCVFAFRQQSTHLNGINQGTQSCFSPSYN